MATTIQVSETLLEQLKKKKISDNETYEEVIWDLIEDSLELSIETKQRIKQAEEEFARGEVYTHEEVKKKLGL